MDGTSKNRFPSTKSALSVDEPSDSGTPSMKTPHFMDGTSKYRFPSTKTPLSVDEPTDFGTPSMKQAQIVDGMTLKSTGEPETKQRVKVTACW